MTEQDVYYALAPGVDAIILPGEQIMFRGPGCSIRVGGHSARILADQVLPLLDGKRNFGSLCSHLSNVNPETLRRFLDELVMSGALRNTHDSIGTGDAPPFSAPHLLASGASAVEFGHLAQRLRESTVLIVGMEGHGAYVAMALAASGVGQLILSDPYPCQSGNLQLMPALPLAAVGQPRETIVQTQIMAAGYPAVVKVSSLPAITEDGLASMITTADLVVGCFGRGLNASNHWINAAALRCGTPALYVELMGATALVGPLVLPRLTACYTCYQLRVLASEQRYDEALAYAHHLGGMRYPLLHEGGVLASVAPIAGGMAAAEVLMQLLGPDDASLASRMVEVDGLHHTRTVHTILPRPDCPSCRASHPRRADAGHYYRTSALESYRDANQGDIVASEALLVSPRTGVIGRLDWLLPDPGDPEQPQVLCAALSNAWFSSETGGENCFGKGFDPDAARASALGEAVERYAGHCWDDTGFIYARLGEVPGPAVHPRELVLFAPEQYAHLPYQPYRDLLPIAWTQAQSLITDNTVYVPAFAVFSTLPSGISMEAPPLAPTTTNGLATGQTVSKAMLAALLEVLERDAFLLSWMHRLPTIRVDPRTHPEANVRDLVKAYEDAGITLQLNRLPTDHPAIVFAALAIDGTGTPAVTVGLGADLTAREAARKALLEATQVRRILRRRMRDPDMLSRLNLVTKDPRAVVTGIDHALRYADQTNFGAFDFLMRASIQACAWETETPSTIDALCQLRDHFNQVNVDVLYRELTPADVALLGLHVVRVVVSGFQPMHFGQTESRLGGDRLFAFPQALGYAAHYTMIKDLNPDPHPFA